MLMLGESLQHTVHFPVSKQTMIDKEAFQSFAYRAMQQYRHDRGVDSTAQPEEHHLAFKIFVQRTDLLFDKRGRSPIVPAATDAYHEVAQKQPALIRMGNLWVKLNGIITAPWLPGSGKWGIISMPERIKTGRKHLNLVAMAHPYLTHIKQLRSAALPSHKEGVGSIVNGQPGRSEFTTGTSGNTAA
jgi:hypothetical protein